MYKYYLVSIGIDHVNQQEAVTDKFSLATVLLCHSHDLWRLEEFTEANVV